MPRWSQRDLIAYEARQRQDAAPADSDGVEREVDLHDAIIEDCKRRGWICDYSSMIHKTHRNVGEQDFTILASGGRVFLVECKRKGGKLTPEQLGRKVWAGELGHTVHVIRTVKEWMDLANGSRV